MQKSLHVTYFCSYTIGSLKFLSNLLQFFSSYAILVKNSINLCVFFFKRLRKHANNITYAIMGFQLALPLGFIF